LDGTFDGHATPDTCAHEKFTGIDQAPGIDNQLYRVLGCQTGYRNPNGADGFIAGFRRKYIRETVINRILVEISDVQDERNDEDVTVTTYRGMDKLLENAAGDVLPWQTQRVDAKATDYVHHLHGRIVDGVLITDPVDFELPETLFINTKFEL